MSTLSLRLPESIHRNLKALAEREGISINQLINSAVAEELAALMTEESSHNALRAARRKLTAVLSTGFAVEISVPSLRSMNPTAAQARVD